VWQNISQKNDKVISAILNKKRITMRKKIFYMTIPLFFTGCISIFEPKVDTQNIAIHGETKTDTVLQHDILESITKNVNERGCPKIKSTFTEVLKIYSLKPNNYKIQERWTAFGCEKEFGYYVVLKGDKEKGTKYTITQIK
jgi:hypothetical protein